MVSGQSDDGCNTSFSLRKCLNQIGQKTNFTKKTGGFMGKTSLKQGFPAQNWELV